MIKSWMFEFLHAPTAQDGEVARRTATAVFEKDIALWKRLDTLGFEGIFFSEHHFGLSYSPSPNLLIAAIAQSTTRLRLGAMGVVLPLYQPWRVLEEMGMLDHLTGGRLEIGCASGVPQELIQTGIGPGENRDRFTESLQILDAWLVEPVISYQGRYYNFDKLRVVPRLLQPSPPKWTTVVSTASAIKICRAPLEDLHGLRIRRESTKSSMPTAPKPIGSASPILRTNLRSVATSRRPSEAEAYDRSQMAKEGRKGAGGRPARAPALLFAPGCAEGQHWFLGCRHAGPGSRTDHRAMPRLRCRPYRDDPGPSHRRASNPGGGAVRGAGDPDPAAGRGDVIGPVRL
jgi:hypothetical protein